jgi:hypothetical protein
MLSDKDLADVKKLFSSRKPFNERYWGLILIEEIQQLRRMKATSIRNVRGIKAPKRSRCAVCRLSRKTDCSAKIEIVGGMWFAESRSVEMPICKDCTTKTLNAQRATIGMLLLNDSLESVLRTLVRYEHMLNGRPVTKRVAQKAD